MHTATHVTTAAATSSIKAKVAALNERIVKRGLGEQVTVTFGDPFTRHDDLTGAPSRWVNVTISLPPVALPGGWALAAVADWSSTDTPLVHNVTGVTELTFDDVDRTRCDHCGTRRIRNVVYVLANKDGDTAHVGSSCLRDFLGTDAERLLLAWQDLAAEIDDEELFRPNYGAWGVPLVTFVAHAQAAVVTWGWASSASLSSTRSAALNILTSRADKDDVELIAAQHLAVDPATEAYAVAAIEWARNLNPTSDFDRNLCAVATSDVIGAKALGIAAYLPVAYARHLDSEAHRAAEKARRPEPTDCPTGRVEIEGEVIGLKWHQSDYGSTLKMTIIDDSGFRVWVSAPAAIEDDVTRGARIRLVATVTPSDDDTTFGFGKRPSKAEVLATVPA